MQAERRAVLAHELAHVCRGDFLAGLVAQLSLALHFYHPLAHWLAARLRLEQELAADAWGAALSGGKTTYLATLAQMALRRDSRALTWPARAFLPSRGTFVRRIEMLQDTQANSVMPPSRPQRDCSPSAFSPLSACWSPACAGRPAGPSAQAQVAGQGLRVRAERATVWPRRRCTTWPSCRPMRRWSSPCGPRLLLERREIRSLLESFGKDPALKGVLDRHRPRTSNRSSCSGKELLSSSRGRRDTTDPAPFGCRAANVEAAGLEDAPRLSFSAPRKRSVTTARRTSAPPRVALRPGVPSRPTTGRWSWPRKICSAS